MHLIECAKDETTREKFFENPHYYLNEKVGMKIPEEVQVLLDAQKLTWPEIYIKIEDEKIYVGEGRLAIEVIDELTSGSKIDEKTKLTEQAEVDVIVHEALKNSQVVVKLPFYDARSDVLGEVKFADDTEIILTTCWR